MSIKMISYKKTGYFSDLICDYLSEKESLTPFYHRFPSLPNLKSQLKEKQSSFKQEQRTALVDSLKKQYEGINASAATRKNINALLDKNAFTITTGHQLNLFTGPLYFLYKIFTTINLSEKLNKEHSEYNFIPVYWMASEDHDFEEINFFNLNGNKFEWKRDHAGVVGELSTEGLEELFSKLESELGNNEFAKYLLSIFNNAYLKQKSLAWATRFLANELFSTYGLVIVDGNNAELKKQFIPFAEREITEKRSFDEVEKTTHRLESLGYKKQVQSREINLFYIDAGIRERIIEKNNKYYVNNTEKEFSYEEIVKEINDFPIRFSPNVLLRPLYQEVILPNLCYIGGGGELAYWLQLKDYFNSVEVPFPVLLLRNSLLLVSNRQYKKLKKLNFEVESLFLAKHDLENLLTKKRSDIDIDFTQQKSFLKEQFKALYELAEKTDGSFVGAVAAQEKKQLNGLKTLEKRLLKAEKRKLADELKRLSLLQDQLFPKGSLQERTVNFSEFYMEYGDELFKLIKDNIKPLSGQFNILELP